MTNSKSNKTLLGIPADLQAVLQKLKEEEAARNGQKPLVSAAPSAQPLPAGPSASGAVLPGSTVPNLTRTQYGNPHGGAEPDDSRYAAAVVPERSPSGFPPPSAAGQSAPAAYNARAATSLNRTLIGMSPTDIAAAQAAVAAHMARAHAGATVPPELPSRQSTGEVAVSARPLMIGGEPGTAAEFGPSQAQHLALSAEDSNPLGGSDGSARDPIGGNTTAADRPRLSLPRDEPAGAERASRPRVSNAPKRWPALALLGLALFGGAGVIVTRVPLFGAGAVALTPADTLEPSPQHRQTTETSVAAVTREVAKAGPALLIATSSGPGAPLKSGSAELERQAIDLLVENDYAGAAKLYERLRSAEPARPEYAVMLEVLARQAAACGQPGQEPCAAH
jgi:hypothetical protein